MRTEFDIKTDIYLLIKDSELAKSISGKLKKTKRPYGSGKEDIVISVLSDPSDTQIEEVYVNLNIYVPDIKRDNQYEEDSIRLNELCKLTKDALKNACSKGYCIHLQTQKTYEVPGKNEHFINNKILYKICNE